MGQQRSGVVAYDRVPSVRITPEIHHLSILLHGVTGQAIGRKIRVEHHGAHQTHRHQYPQSAQYPFGGEFFQQRPQQQEGQYQPAGCHRHIEGLDEQLSQDIHGHPSLRNVSIIRWISSTSAAESFLREVKAVMKAGSEPSKVSSTNRSVLAA